MSLTPDESSVLLAALAALRGGDSRRFQDLLWLGLGDRWGDVQDGLLARGLAEWLDAARTRLRLTGRGVEWVKSLGLGADARLEPGVTPRGVRSAPAA
ncbi:MAG: hypothetical protein KDA05_04260 [Phycisphaerales bacterium]|nr:hypothetical protein [Phycisphaerales bacterium]MCB9840788.1 hypothetical protein [Phycisphaeraceae bacterium]